MRKQSIGVVIGNFPPDGGGIFQYIIAMLDAAAALDPAQYAVRVFTRNKRWRSIARARGLPVARILSFGHGEIRKWLAKIPFSPYREILCRKWNRLAPTCQSIKRHHVDIAVFPDQSPPLPLPPAVKQVYCIHDLMHRYESRFSEVGNPGEYAARERLYKAMVEQSAAIIVDSEIGKQHVVESYAAESSTVFPLPYIIYDGLKKAVPLRPPSLPKGIEGRYLYYPAQFWSHKNHARLLEAVASLRHEFDINCVFSGDTRKNGYESFLESVSRLGLEKSVHCLGYVSEEEISWLYQNARCMIMPTFFGPTNIPPLEAMHFGCPVGVSGIYGIPEQLGDAAVYFDPQSVADMARGIRRLWTDESLRTQCIQKGIVVAQAHSAANFSAGLAHILQTLCK